MNTQAGSYLDATVPYVLENDGYTTKVNGQLMNVDATSSLQFRSFLECETLQVRKGDVDPLMVEVLPCTYSPFCCLCP